MPSCRRSALLKDDNLLEFYHQDTKTAYDMFQRGLGIAGLYEQIKFQRPFAMIFPEPQRSCLFFEDLTVELTISIMRTGKGS